MCAVVYSVGAFWFTKNFVRLSLLFTVTCCVFLASRPVQFPVFGATDLNGCANVHVNFTDVSFAFKSYVTVLKVRAPGCTRKINLVLTDDLNIRYQVSGVFTAGVFKTRLKTRGVVSKVSATPDR